MRTVSDSAAGDVPVSAAAIAGVERGGGRARVVVNGLVRSVRPRQWSKNLLVFAAPGAGGVLLHPAVLWRAGLAFAVFCLGSGSAYLLNDLLDLRSDRLHPVRRERPIATGAVGPGTAAIAAVVLAGIALAASTVLGTAFVVTVGAYLAVAASYSVWLKRIAVLDIAAVSAGFVIRAIGGSAATGVPLSQWFLILVSFGALFVVAGKRSAEYAAMGERIGEVRTPMLAYSAAYLRYVWMVASAVAIAAYCLWAFDQPHALHGVPWSELSAIPFVLAVLRYALVVDGGGGGTPEDVFVADRPLLALMAVWLVVYGCGVYLGR